jgi:hypothetical protein
MIIEKYIVEKNVIINLSHHKPHLPDAKALNMCTDVVCLAVKIAKEGPKLAFFHFP